jgi:hypothetical protein
MRHKGNAPSSPWLLLHYTNKLMKAVPWLRRLVANFSPRRSEFDPASVRVGFIVDKAALEQVFPRVLLYSLSISSHPCGVPLHGKTEETDFLHHSIAQYASRLRCFRSICCGPLHPQKSNVRCLIHLIGRFLIRRTNQVLFYLSGYCVNNRPPA